MLSPYPYAMSFAARLGDAATRRPLALVGLAFAAAGVTHFYQWTDGAAPGRQFSDALGQGNYATAAPELVAYATGHPAYVAAVVVGVALLFRGE